MIATTQNNLKAEAKENQKVSRKVNQKHRDGASNFKTQKKPVATHDLCMQCSEGYVFLLTCGERCNSAIVAFVITQPASDLL